MCQRIACPTCGKPGYAGCGRHVESVLADVPQAERCQCREGDAKREPATRDSWFRALFGGEGEQP